MHLQKGTNMSAQDRYTPYTPRAFARSPVKISADLGNLSKNVFRWRRSLRNSREQEDVKRELSVQPILDQLEIALTTVEEYFQDVYSDADREADGSLSFDELVGFKPLTQQAVDDISSSYEIPESPETKVSYVRREHCVACKKVYPMIAACTTDTPQSQCTCRVCREKRLLDDLGEDSIDVKCFCGNCVARFTALSCFKCKKNCEDTTFIYNADRPNEPHQLCAQCNEKSSSYFLPDKAFYWMRPTCSLCNKSSVECWFTEQNWEASWRCHACYLEARFTTLQ